MSFHGGCPYDTMVSKWSWQAMALYGAHLVKVFSVVTPLYYLFRILFETSLFVIYMNHKVGGNDVGIDIDGDLV